MRPSERLIDKRLESAEQPTRQRHQRGPKDMDRSNAAKRSAQVDAPERKKGQQKWQQSAKAKAFNRKMSRQKGRFDR